MNIKKGCGIGALVLFSAAVALMGAATWYSRSINREYKAVQKSEQALLTATGDRQFAPPADLVVPAARLDAFLSVRDSLQDEAQTLTAAAGQFARERDRDRGQGLKGFLNLLRSGSDLAPIYATYWTARNHALQSVDMSPAEYRWLYDLVYYKWLDKDPSDGRDDHTTAPIPQMAIPGALPAATLAELAPRRLRLEAAYHFELNPIELVFNQAPTGTE